MTNKKELTFLTIEQVAEQLKNNTFDVVIWGTGLVAEEVYETLNAHNIKVNYFGDNSCSMQGKHLHGCKILSSLEVVQLELPYVVIGSYVYRPISEKLFSLGIKHVYGLIDCMKYNAMDMQSDRHILNQYFVDYEHKQSNKILVEVYGNIGDAILRLGIVRAIIDVHGSEQIYILVESESIAESFRLVTRNVIVFEKKRYRIEEDYRLDKLIKLNEIYFEKSVVLCDIRLHATRRPLNSLNFNVRNVIYHIQLPTDEYLLDLDIEMIKKEFKRISEKNMLPVGCINDELESIAFQYGLPERYVSVNLGASINERHYPADRFVKVIDYLSDKGYEVALLGQGDYDEEYAEKLLKTVRNNNKVWNFISKLSIVESLYVIRQSEFFVGTDSGMWNASYILNKSSVVLYGGGEYGCFKHKSEKIHYVMVEHKSCFGCRWYCKNKNEHGYSKCVGDIKPQMIIDKVNEIILNNESR